MTIDLCRDDHDHFQFAYFGIWLKVMALARLYGWQPMGTLPPLDWRADEDGIWAGGYDIYRGETVREVDASALADALTEALDDLPDHAMPERIIETEIEEIDLEGQISVSYHIIEPNPHLSLFETFGGHYKWELVDFIDFCRDGSFQIHNLASRPSA